MEEDEVQDDKERYNALLLVYRTLQSLDVPDIDTLHLSETQYDAFLQELPEAFLEDARHGIIPLRNADFWNTVSVAMDSNALRQFFVEQLVLHHYVNHRVFLCPRNDADEWFPCDVHAEKYEIHAPGIFRNTSLMHSKEDGLHLLVYDSVDAAFGPLPFDELYRYADYPFLMKELRETESAVSIEEYDELRMTKNDITNTWMISAFHLHLLDDYDPSYFEELFEVGEKTLLENHYFSPLLMHDILVHAQPIKMKDDAIEYINTLLPSVYVPYRHWLQFLDHREGPFFLYRLFKFLQLKY